MTTFQRFATRLGGRAIVVGALIAAGLAGVPASRSWAQEDEKAIILLPLFKPDLEVASFRVTGTIASGATISFAWGVRNSSQKAATGTWVDRLYVATSKSSLTSAQVIHSANSPNGLAAASGYTRTFKVTLPRLSSGTYYVWLVTDAANAISEESETNNSKLYGPVAVSIGAPAPRLLPEEETLYVSADRGDDEAGYGTLTSPLRGLDAALSHAATYASETLKVGVRLGAGVYSTDLTLPSNVEIIGANPFDPGETIIRPTIDAGGTGLRLTGQRNVVRDLTIQVNPKDKGRTDFSLLTLDNASAAISNVVFDGSGTVGSIGIESVGAGSNDAVISRCLFTSLQTGVDTFDSGPTISRCVFKDIAGDAILVRGSGAKAVRTTPLLGTASSIASGYNRFEGVGGFFVNNQTSELMKAELNVWGVDFELLGNLFNGPTDFDPPVTTFSLQSSVLVSVISAEDNAPIFNASLTLSPNPFPALSENVDGVYPFPICPPGSYTLQVSAPGFFDEVENFEVEPATTVTEVLVQMTPDNAEPKVAAVVHSSDADTDDVIDLSELLRVTQLFNASAIRCLTGSEDGYAPGVGDKVSCPPHAADYNSTNWKISLSELLRTIQLFRLGAYHPCDEGEDGFCPGAK